MNRIGLGDKDANIVVYCQNTPPLEYYQQLTSISPMNKGEIKMIADKTGNHWRKIFNVYAKFLYELWTPAEDSWQSFRDKKLLAEKSKTVLLFSPFTKCSSETQDKAIHIIMGKQYASSLINPEQLTWLSNDFAIDEQNRTIVCPYFDYRQLSNEKITKLCGLVNHIKKQSLVT
jgi:hypothetical protein